MDKEEIFKIIEQKMHDYDSFMHIPSPSPEDSEEISLIKHYFYVNEMLASLIVQVGAVGKALQGEDDLAENLLSIASVCAKWLENINKPLL
jgi:hypothetical protein